jgi:hypothetical protein
MPISKILVDLRGFVILNLVFLPAGKQLFFPGAEKRNKVLL